MKTAIYITEGVTQLVLTPETEWEKTATKGLKEDSAISISRGSFYLCNGGWDRMKDGDDSVILRIGKEIQ